MAKVQFDEEQVSTGVYKQVTPKGLTGFLIKAGVAQTTSQANLLMIVLFVIIIAVLAFTQSGVFDPPPVTPSQEEIDLLEYQLRTQGIGNI